MTDLQLAVSGLRRQLFVVVVAWAVTSVVLAGIALHLLWRFSQISDQVSDLHSHSWVFPDRYVQFGSDGVMIASKQIWIPGPGDHTQGIQWNNFPGLVAHNGKVFEEGEIHFIDNTFTIRTAGGAAGGGRGAARDIGIAPNDTVKWRFAVNGGLYAEQDARYDIGSRDGHRPRNVFIAGDLVVKGKIIQGK